MADPYRAADVSDSHAPPFSQAGIGSLALVASVAQLERLPAVLGAQPAVGLTLVAGERVCIVYTCRAQTSSWMTSSSPA